MITRRRPRRLPLWRRGFPFFLAKPRTAVERFRAAAAWRVWTDGPTWKRVIIGGVMAVTWPIVTLVEAIRFSSYRTDLPIPRTFARLYSAALLYNIPPSQHVQYETFWGYDTPLIPHFLLPLDLRGLYKLNLDRGAVPSDVQDKAKFERLCSLHGLRCVPTLAWFADGSSAGEEGLRAWTEPFFVKSLSGNRGAGAERWRRDADCVVSSQGVQKTFEELIRGLRTQNCIVQPVLEDCAELKALGSVALSSVRVVTAKGATIPAIAIAATFSLATDESAVISHDGPMCGINLGDGTIANVRIAGAEASGGCSGPIEEKLIGSALPFWSETLDLALSAHEKVFPEFVTLGWDVALTPAGPILLETNVGWGMTPHQLLMGPLGKSALADVLDELVSSLRRH